MEIKNLHGAKSTLDVLFMDGRPRETRVGVSSVFLVKGFLVAEVGETLAGVMRLKTEAWALRIVSQWRWADYPLPVSTLDERQQSSVESKA